MREQTGIVHFRGTPVTLIGPALKAGDKAPEFQLVDTDLRPVGLDDFAGKTLIICTVPSLDTPVCDAETRKFNQEAEQLPEDVKILVVSLDLPFAQKRWCAASGADRVNILSDYRDRSFGPAYGVLIKELQLLSRSIFVIGPDDILRYVHHVPEITDQPDYAAVIEAARGDIVTRQVPGDGFCGGY